MERIADGEVLRPIELHVLPGGKGVNAARAAVALGGRVITTGIAGGHTGRWLVEALSAEGLEPHWSFAKAESRTTYVTVDRDGRSVLVYERPAVATEDEFANFLRLLEERLLPTSARAIVAGSIPTGVTAGGHAAIVETCRRASVPLLVDASGPGLLAALEGSPDIVKIGRAEAVEAGIVVDGAPSSEVAGALVARGARLAVVTDGPADVVAADATALWRLTAPRIDAVNPVGSGDAFNAAMSLALMEGADIAAGLRKGVAAGAANALTMSAGSIDLMMASAFEDDIEIVVSGRQQR